MSSLQCSPLPATVPPLEDENLLQEILLRLSSQPSSLPRTSLVCSRWRNILSDPGFLRRFRKHHRKPPLLGFFQGSASTKYVFTPALDSADRIPAARFSVPKRPEDEDWEFHGCRNGLAVLINVSRREVVVWDPLTGQRHCVNFPPGIVNEPWEDFCRWNAAVLCTDVEDGHAHGDCFSSPFKLALVCGKYPHAFGSLYDSASGVWGTICSTVTPKSVFYTPSILVKNALCWLICGGDILVFDLEMQSLGVTEKPADGHVTDNWCVQPLRMEDGGLGLALSSELTIELWERKSNSDGMLGWVLMQKITPLDGLFQWRICSDHNRVFFAGYDEDTNVILLSMITGIFKLQLDSMQIKHIIKRDNRCCATLYPYGNFYTAGRGVGCKWMDLELNK